MMEWVHKALPSEMKVQMDKPALKSFLKVTGVPYYIDISAVLLNKKIHPHICPELVKNSLLGSALKKRINSHFRLQHQKTHQPDGHHQWCLLPHPRC